MSSLAIKGNGLQSKLLWAAVIALGALSFGIVALSRGENVNAAWLVIAAVCIYLIAYRFYALFIAEKVLGVDPTRQTPAYQHNDGLDYTMTASITCRPTAMCCSVTTSRQLLAPVPWLVRCSPPRWATCLGRYGFWPASFSPVRCRI